MYACLDLSVSSSSWGLVGAAVCDCGTPWTFLLPFLAVISIEWILTMDLSSVEICLYVLVLPTSCIRVLVLPSSCIRV